MSRAIESPAATCPKPGTNPATPKAVEYPSPSLSELAVPMIPAPALTRRRMFNPLEAPAAPWKRLYAPVKALPSGSSPIASMPAFTAPLPSALVTHGFLYQGCDGAALMVAPLFAAGQRPNGSLKFVELLET